MKAATIKRLAAEARKALAADKADGTGYFSIPRDAAEYVYYRERRDGFGVAGEFSRSGHLANVREIARAVAATV